MAVRLGMLTPSSNTVLEPMTGAILAAMPEVSAHFSRFGVTEIDLSAGSRDQFELAPMLASAKLLADARVDAIAWNGTSASWLGFERDRAFCQAITAETGIPATSTTLASLELFRACGVARWALVTPYRDDVQDRIVANYAAEGFDCVTERHLGISENFAFAEVGADAVREMIRAVAAEKPDAILILCTNVAGAGLVAELEAALGIPICDSVALTLWKCLAMAGADMRPLGGWGRLFAAAGAS